jgi:hypothetical protein
MRTRAHRAALRAGGAVPSAFAARVTVERRAVSRLQVLKCEISRWAPIVRRYSVDGRTIARPPAGEAARGTAVYIGLVSQAYSEGT